MGEVIFLTIANVYCIFEPIHLLCTVMIPVSSKPVYLWNATKCIEVFHSVPSLLLPCPNMFETCCLHQIQNKHIFQKTN